MSLQSDYKKLFSDFKEQFALLDKYRISFDRLWDKWEASEASFKILTEKYSRDINNALEDSNKRVADTIRNYENWIKSHSFNLLTKRVVAWETRVLGKALSESKWERTMRLLEESLELAQSEKISVGEVDMLVKRVFSRPIGEFSQETGGIMVCMLAYAYAAQIDLIDVLNKEVDRIEMLDPEVVREKQRQKWDAGVGTSPDV